MWSWPLPGFVPWNLKYNPDGTLPTPRGQSVHAVEDGTVTQKGFTSLVIKGKSGDIHYGGIDPLLQEGDPVFRSNQIGTIVPGVPESFFGISLFVGEQPIPTAPLLFQAWAQVTDRFHRDAIPPPMSPTARKELVNWILNHPLWEHPFTILVPPDYETNQICFNGPQVEGMPPGYRHLRAVDETWVEKDIGDGSIYDCLCFEFHYVDPTTERIEDDDAFNTAFRVWIEAGGWEDRRKTGEPEPDGGWNEYNRWRPTFSLGLECGGPTMEEALIQLALRVQFYCGIGTKWLDRPDQCDGDLVDPDEIWVSNCMDAGDGFCKNCGYLMSTDEVGADEQSENSRPD